MIDASRVSAVRQAMPDEVRLDEAADLFALLGDTNRLRLVLALLEGGEMCVADLAATTGMSESATSHAIRLLRAHRVVSTPRREGRLAYYRLADAHVRMLVDVTLLHTEHAQAIHPERGEHDG